jgi:PhzF family phenazine biosynthesis protein
MLIQVHIVNAFVDGGTGGNPAGVVLDADALDNPRKQFIAERVGSSETAFVSSSAIADFKLEFFTPTRQIAHCGHATIAAFSYLRQIGRITKTDSSKETIDGRREIKIENDMTFMEQRAPVYQAVGPAAAAVLSAIGLGLEDLQGGQRPHFVNTGNTFLVVPLTDASGVRRVRPDLKAMAAISETHDLIGFYVFCTQTDVPGRDAGARMFAPRYGIPEESATGMAAGPLACYLYDVFGMRKDTFVIEQGHWMPAPSPSVITVKLDLAGGKIKKLMAGGKARLMKTLDFRI